jgi:protein-S-isoprenylcysteine O-methyltransferase Ste14
MPRLAIALSVLWFVSLFVFRTVVQWRRTGSTGLKGFHGPFGSLPWIAGTSTSLGFALAPLAPIGTLLHWPGGTLLVASPPLHIFGATCVVAGIVGALLAQLSMGDSWRVGVDEAETTELVTTGPFARVRNPIFTFMGLSLIGLILLVPNILSLIAGALAVLGIEIQVRAVEEPYLKRTHGVAYRQYASRVGRFVPGVGRLHRSEQAIGTGPARG